MQAIEVLHNYVEVEGGQLTLRVYPKGKEVR